MAAMGAALGTMVGQLTYGRRKFESVDEHMRDALPDVHAAMMALVPMIDADTDAFGQYVTAMALPQGTEDERTRRHAAMQAGLRQAVEVPLATMRTADRAWEAMVALARHANIAMRSDLEVGARALESGIWGCQRNVLINLTDIEDKEFTTRVREESRALSARGHDKSEEVLRILAGR
jgi:glutamate formiminotransferase/formiminotetrahydrofolate cyclodeaminase